ncbi:hypothetical protein AB0O52_17495 [Arthrobacter sp. NPDC080073]|uniref:hypothetical protein n=1 Tax=Arthrobacter sp. NPDC080073 TaxID=3155919 RepID=UPI00341D348C
MAVINFGDESYVVSGDSGEISDGISTALRGGQPLNLEAALSTQLGMRVAQKPGRLVIGQAQAFFVTD